MLGFQHLPSVTNFSQFKELQILGPNLSKKYERKEF